MPGADGGAAGARQETPGRSAARWAPCQQLIGGDLLSREVALRVPSALAGLTSLFGMGRGVSLPV